MPDEQRRAPAKPKDIEQIDPQRDIRVRIVGTVIDMEDESVKIDDGTGSAEVFATEDQIDELEENQRVRILGRVLPTPDGFEVQAEAFQDFSSVDSELYDRVKKVVNTSQ